MFYVNMTELEEEGIKYLDNLTGNKRMELRNEMVKFLKENYYHGTEDYCYILEFVNDFFLTNPENNTKDFSSHRLS